MNGEAGACGMGGGGVLIMIIQLVIALVVLVAMWKVYVKAGKPGWAVIIPFYNAYVFLKIAGKPGWWLIWFFIPLLNLIFGIIATVAFAQKFGKGAGFVVGLILLPFIFFPILGFGDAKYIDTGDSVNQGNTINP